MKEQDMLQMAEVFAKDEDMIHDLAKATYKAVNQALAVEGFSPESVVAVTNLQLETLDWMLKKTWDMAKQRGDATPQCRSGCNICCYQNVVLSTAELCAMVYQIKREEWPALRERTRRGLERLAGRGEEARFRDAIPCPVLEGKHCGAYEARPQACRTHYSMNRSACEREWRLRLSSKESKGIPMPGSVKSLGVAISLGLDRALYERGLEIELVELSEGLAVILEDGALETWLSGGRVFSGVRRVMAVGKYYSDFVEEEKSFGQ